MNLAEQDYNAKMKRKTAQIKGNKFLFNETEYDQTISNVIDMIPGVVCCLKKGDL